LDIFHKAVIANEQVLQGSAEFQAVPYSLVEIAEILFKRKEFKEAERYIKKAELYDNFEFQQLLHYRMSRKIELIKEIFE